MTRRYAFLCDFDGTIAPDDVGAQFLATFAPGKDAERRVLLEAWKRDAIGSRELTTAECGMARASEADAMQFVARFVIDPAFAPFAREAESRGDRVLVVSDGFDFYIRALLDRAGVPGVAYAANRLRFEGDHLVPEFPHSTGGCGRCGNCKGAHVRNARAEGFEVIVVGDGWSDRCAARMADHVLARGSLAAWCAEHGIGAHGFDGFGDVARFARDLPGRAEA